MKHKELIKCAEETSEKLIKFLMDIVSIKSLSGQEKEVINRIADEMMSLGYDEVKIDGFGNVIGRIGSGSKIIAIDGHVDTVDLGDINQWKVTHPLKPAIVNGRLYGRGTADQKGGFACAVYGGWLLKEKGLLDDFTLFVVGSVQEEECDGLCWRWIIEKEGIKPDVVILTEPTSLRIYRGQRGRAELYAETFGVSAHGSTPHLGVNAIYKMCHIIPKIEELNESLKPQGGLAKGTICVTQIFSESPSANAVPDRCRITLDRRLTFGEDEKLVIDQLKELSKELNVGIYEYDRPTWKGTLYPVKKYYPTWIVDESHIAVKTAKKVYKSLFNKEPVDGFWKFSTNGVSICGVHKIPCVGFGPGNEEQAHAPDEYVEIEQLPKACAFYALFPLYYCKNY